MPLVLLCLGMTAWKLPSSGRPNSHVAKEDVLTSEQREPQLDCAGIGLLGTTIFAFIILCQSIEEENLGPSMTWVVLAVLLASGLLLVLQETLRAKDPIIPFSVIGSNGIGIICFVQMLLMGSMFGVRPTGDQNDDSESLLTNFVYRSYQAFLSFL